MSNNILMDGIVPFALHEEKIGALNSSKVDKFRGVNNAGKVQIVNGEGYLTDMTLPEGTATPVDATLTTPDYAADAAATGAAIKRTKNLFDANKVLDGYAILSNRNYAVYAVCCVSDFVPVVPNGKLVCNQHLNSSVYGHLFFDRNKIKIGFSASNSYEHNVPEGAYYVRLTVLKSSMSDFVCYCEGQISEFAERNANGLYDRHVFQEKGFPIGDSTSRYKAFSSGCIFNGLEIHSCRAAYQHTTPDDTDLYGHIQLDYRENGGTWRRKVVDLSSVTDEEPRDINLSIAKYDGYPLMTFFTSAGNGYMCKLDANLDVSDSIQLDVVGIPWGNTLTTPNGYLLHTTYGSNKSRLYRSTTPYAGTLTGLEFELAKELQSTTGATETSIGYHRDRLVAIIRNDGGNSYSTYTTDLEGLTGWTTPAQMDGKYHAPVMLHDCDTEFLLVGVSEMGSGYTRTAKLMLYDEVANRTIVKRNIDTAVTDFGGYESLVNLGGDDFGICYFEDATYTGYYYKRVNASALLGAEYRLPAITSAEKIASMIEKILPDFTTESADSAECYPAEGTRLYPTVTIKPMQEGSGTPSPSNIRNISGFTDATVQNTNGTNTDSIVIEFGRTAYAGVLNVKNKTLTLTHKMVVLDESSAISWYTPSFNVYDSEVQGNVSDLNSVYCNQLAPHLNSGIASMSNAITVDGANHIFFRMDDYNTDLAALKAYLADHPIQVCWTLKTPTVVQLTDIPVIYAMSGKNTLTCDAGQIAVSGKADIGHLIGGQ